MRAATSASSLIAASESVLPSAIIAGAAEKDFFNARVADSRVLSLSACVTSMPAPSLSSM